MESVIHLLMGFIVLNFILKIGFYPRWGVWLAGIGCAVFLLAIGEWATEQSATEIASLFASRSRMLTFSVYITLEASVMIAFCFNCFAKVLPHPTLFRETVSRILNLYPGLLMAVVLAYLLPQLFFTFPGISFRLITVVCSVSVFILIPIISLLLKSILGETRLRLEMLFITSLFVVLLSIIVTGNH